MQKELISSIYLDPSKDQNQSAHAITANVTTRQGFELSVVAMSQKKSGFFTPIDTPRKALLSFVTSLQNGAERTVEQIIFRAINAVNVSTGGYTKRRGGAPCGLTAGIVHDGVLYTVQVGAGEIFYIQNKSLHLLTYLDGKRPSRQKWLGETKELSVQQINMQKLRLSAGSTILICRPEFINSIVDEGAEFKSYVLTKAQKPDTLAQSVAEWAQIRQISFALTFVAQQWTGHDVIQQPLARVDNEIETLQDQSGREPVVAEPLLHQAESDVTEYQESPAIEVAPAENQPEDAATELIVLTPDEDESIIIFDQTAELSEEVEDVVNHRVEGQEGLGTVVEESEAEETYVEPISHSPAFSRTDNRLIKKGPISVEESDSLSEADKNIDKSDIQPDVAVAEEIDGILIDESELEELILESSVIDPEPAKDPTLAPPISHIGEAQIEEEELTAAGEPEEIIPLPKNVIEVDLVEPILDYDTTDFDFDNDDELDTQKMEPVVKEPQAPVRVNGFHESTIESKKASSVTELDLEPAHRNEPLKDPTELADRSRLIRYSLIGLAVAFLAVISAGVFLTFERIIFATDSQARQEGETEVVEASGSETSSTGNSGVLVPIDGFGPAIGSYSQGSSNTKITIYEGGGLGARGLIAFAIGNQDYFTEEEDLAKNVYAWSRSTFSFDKKAAGSSFRANEKSTFFLDSRNSTIRPELAQVFGIAESSAGCMSINYRSFDQPIIMSCYSGTCRWRGPLNQNYDIPAGQRLSIRGNSRAADSVSFDPIFRTETTVYASTMNAVPGAREVVDQCLDPYIEERRQLSLEESTAIANTITAGISRQIGYSIQGNDRSRRIIDVGDIVGVRGLSRIVIGDVETTEPIADYELYAWAGSSIHFNPNLETDQFEIGENSVLFLNSTDTVIRPIIPDIFGSAESSNGCMSINYQAADQPIIMSCFSGNCQWNGALDKKYRIPVGQRLSIPANPRSDSDIIFESIYPTESNVIGRTLGSIDAGKAISDICVEPFIPERQIQIIAPDSEEEEELIPTPESSDGEAETTDGETDLIEEEEVENLPTLESDPADGEDVEATATPEN